jgi:hypothetical protein
MSYNYTRGSEICCPKIKGILCYGWENSYLSSRENANLLQSGGSKLVYSYVLSPLWRNGSGEMLMWLPGNLKIDYRESRGFPTLYTEGTGNTAAGQIHYGHRHTNVCQYITFERDACDWQLRIGVVYAALCRIFFCARWNSLSFHMSNHCLHQQACCFIKLSYSQVMILNLK